MIPLERITGRLGNKLFQFSALYAYSKENNHDYYCQDEKYFKKYEEDIRKMFGNGIEEIDAVSIHVRRGDYLLIPHSEFHTNLCDTDYYERAIAMFPKEKFIVFSDDIGWCKNYFRGKNFEFSEEKDEIKDFNKQASCRHHIIANSSWSWWCAYLGRFNFSKVVCPREDKWFQDGIIRTKVPKEWIQI